MGIIRICWIVLLLKLIYLNTYSQICFSYKHLSSILVGLKKRLCQINFLIPFMSKTIFLIKNQDFNTKKKKINKHETNTAIKLKFNEYTI